MKMRQITATERLYSRWLKSKTVKAEQKYQLELAAICVKACRAAKLSPPYEREQTDHGPRIRGGPLALFQWVCDWVNEELEREIPLKDGARYLGRRSVLALIDEIRANDRRRRGIPIRIRKSWRDLEETERMRDCMLEAFARVGLPGRLPCAKDRELFSRLMEAYPKRLSNAAFARELGLTEGAIRKRRRRIAEACSSFNDGDYHLQVGLRDLRLTVRYEK